LRILDKIVKFILFLIFAGLIVGVGLFWYAYKAVEVDANRLIAYTPEISSEILDRKGRHISYIFGKRHRLYATFDEIPGFLIEALIATEDTKFFEHKGINPEAIARAILADIKAGRFVEGGSTLTQQLIKNAFLSRKKSISRKIKEAILAIKLEQKLSKEEIIERYLNEIAYGNNYYGVKTAAWGYFHKELKDLTLKEAAMLVGIPNAPSYYNPRRHYERALKRANIILNRMRKLGWIDKVDYQKAIKERPIVYKTSLKEDKAPYVTDEVIRRFKKEFPDLKVGGYKIYTTIDLDIQNLAKEALIEGRENLLKDLGEDSNKSDLNGAIVAVDNKSGDILALVGGYSYKKSPYNRATMSKRQPGSAFKPFIYQIALDLGYNPASYLVDLERTFKYKKNGKVYYWEPKNYERDFKGLITLREALVESRNLATINLVDKIGVDKIIKKLKPLGIKNIPRDLSISLGNLGLSPLKMAQIYTIFSNYGHMIEPHLVNKIISKEKTTIYEQKPKEIANFTKPEQAYLMTSILKDVVKKGTGKRAQVEGIELAGKTGTTNNYIDAWFCGYSPTITTIVWFGRDRYKSIGKGMTGGKCAAPTFALFYEKLLRDKPLIKRKFDIPKGLFEGIVDGHKEIYTKTSPLPKRGGDLFIEDNESVKSGEGESEILF